LSSPFAECNDSPSEAIKMLLAGTLKAILRASTALSILSPSITQEIVEMDVLMAIMFTLTSARDEKAMTAMPG
jgi:hypothetical protein